MRPPVSDLPLMFAGARIVAGEVTILDSIHSPLRPVRRQS